MNFLFFTSDLHIPIHVQRYRQALPILSTKANLYYVYFPLPLYVQLTADQPDYIPFITSKLSSLEQLKTLNQYQDPLLDLHSRSFQSLDPYSFIDDSCFSSIVSSIQNADPFQLQNFTWRGLHIFDYVQRDMSLCLKSRVLDLSSLSNPYHLEFIKLTYIASIVSYEIAHNISECNDIDSLSIHRCILPDAYSAYNAVSAGVNRLGIPSMILTADPHFNDLLKILPADVNPINLASHNVQQIAHEYASPDIYFDLAKLYLEEKVLQGSSSQAYSSAKSESLEQTRVHNFLKDHPKSLVYFTSSPDEQSSNEHEYNTYSLQSGQLSHGIDLFSDEYELLSDLINLSINSGYGLIIRMHPRLGSESRSTQVSTARECFFNLVSSLDDYHRQRILLIEPEVQLSSYWLGVYASANIFYRSSIGTELLMLGLPAISPQHLNSYTYQGNYYETSIAATSISAWHKQIHSVVTQEFSYFVHLVVRGFYIQRFSSTFRVKAGVKTTTASSMSCSDTSSLFSNTNHDEICEYFGVCSSFSLPRIKGYWSLNDYMSPLMLYLRWLLSSAYPQLEIPRHIANRIIRTQINKYHHSLFDLV